MTTQGKTIATFVAIASLVLPTAAFSATNAQGAAYTIAGTAVRDHPGNGFHMVGGPAATSCDPYSLAFNPVHFVCSAPTNLRSSRCSVSVDSFDNGSATGAVACGRLSGSHQWTWITTFKVGAYPAPFHWTRPIRTGTVA